MRPGARFVVVMPVWTVSDCVAKKTKSLLSLAVRGLDHLPHRLPHRHLPRRPARELIAAGARRVVVGFIIVHLGTMISLDDFKKQWRTFLDRHRDCARHRRRARGSPALVFGAAAQPARLRRRLRGQALDFVIAGIGALSGGTISVIIVQEAALDVGLTSIAVFPVLIAALQGLIGFPLTSIILRREAARLKGEYRAGTCAAAPRSTPRRAPPSKSMLPTARFLRNTPGTLFVVGVVVLVSLGHEQPHRRHPQHLRRGADLRHRCCAPSASSSPPCSPASTPSA